MLDLSNINLPHEINLDGEVFYINTDFRFWLKFDRLLNDGQPHHYNEFYFLFSGDRPDITRALPKLTEFFAPPHKLPRRVGSHSGDKILDYWEDSDLIFSAFYETYNIDLLDPKLRLHWWKFLALLSGVHNSKLSEVMEIRSYDESDTSDYKKIKRELREAWRLEVPLTPDEQKDLDYFNSL